MSILRLVFVSGCILLNSSWLAKAFWKTTCEASESLFAGRVMEASIPVVSCSPPPALPPKKRQSAPSPTRVTVVAPMSRATSGSSLPVGINRQVMA